MEQVPQADIDATRLQVALRVSGSLRQSVEDGLLSADSAVYIFSCHFPEFSFGRHVILNQTEGDQDGVL